VRSAPPLRWAAFPLSCSPQISALNLSLALEARRRLRSSLCFGYTIPRRTISRMCRSTACLTNTYEFIGATITTLP
jgi:hypothetical protein